MTHVRSCKQTRKKQENTHDQNTLPVSTDFFLRWRSKDPQLVTQPQTYKNQLMLAVKLIIINSWVFSIIPVFFILLQHSNISVYISHT